MVAFGERVIVFLGVYHLWWRKLTSLRPRGRRGRALRTWWLCLLLAELVADPRVSGRLASA